MSGREDGPRDQSSSETLVDARGQPCPIPIVRLSRAVKGSPVGGSVRLLATDPGAEPDVRAWQRQTGNELVSAERSGSEYHFVVRRLR